MEYVLSNVYCVFMQGCIAEQRIEHTCGESIPEANTAHQDLDRSYSHDSIATFR